MKKVYLLFAFISFIGFSQEKYLTKTGLLNFEASVPSFEEIKATNTNVTAIFNAANGQFATLALVKGFRFKNALMEVLLQTGFIFLIKQHEIVNGALKNKRETKKRTGGNVADLHEGMIPKIPKVDAGGLHHAASAVNDPVGNNIHV